MTVPVDILLSSRSLSLMREDRHILRDINLDLTAGSVVAIVGPNGAGKSTLLKTLAGEIRPDSGEVYLAGRLLEDWTDRSRAQTLAVLPQQSTLSFPFRVREVLALGRMPYQPCSSRQTRQIVDTVLARMDLLHLADRLYPELSGGEQQRVQLARVMVQLEPLGQATPKVVLLDEPAASFDLAHQTMLMQQVRFLASQGVAVLLVLHDLNMALHCADQLVLMDQGRVVTSGTPDSVLSPQLIEEVFGIHVEFLMSSTGRRVLCFE